MKKEMIEGKKIRIVINGIDYFYTVNKVLDITSTHISFLDKFNNQKMLRISEIVETVENLNTRGDMNGEYKKIR